MKIINNQLTKENAQTAKTIIQIANPEYGVWYLDFNGQPLNDGKFTHIAKGLSGSIILSDGEFKFWSIVEYK
jgi:hypothetical protein